MRPFGGAFFVVIRNKKTAKNLEKLLFSLAFRGPHGYNGGCKW